MVCANCGHENEAGARFCSSCGAALDSAHDTRTLNLNLETGGDDTVTVAPEDLTAGGLLVVVRGPNSGSKFEVDKDLMEVGRHPDSDIFLDDITVSRRHVEITRAGGDFTVRDVGSLNGTYLNRERIEESPLTDHDELQVGTFRLLFLTGPAAS